MNIYKRTKNLVYTSPETANIEFDLTDNFTEIAQRNIENVSKKNGNLDIMLVYHQFNDEKEVAKAAEKETVEKLRKQNKSVNFEYVNEDTLKSFVSDKMVKEQCAVSQPQKVDKSWIKTLVEFIIAALSFAAAIPTVLTFVQNSKIVLSVLLGVAIVIGAAFTVLSALDLVKTVKRKKAQLSDLRKNLDISAACKWDEKDFVYKSQNNIYVFFNTSASDAYWQLFKKYLECLPKQTAFSCIIFKLVNNPTNNLKYFSEVFAGKDSGYNVNEKSKFEQINPNKKAQVFGYVLAPLTDEEKRVCVEELKNSHKFVSRGIANGGRDSLYRLMKNDGILDEANYFNLVNNIYDNIKDKSQLNKDGIRAALSFLAALKSILSLLPNNVNVSGSPESDMFFNSELLQKINSELLENGEAALKNTLCYIWKVWQNDLMVVADREYQLLITALSADWSIAPYKWAIESFLNYIGYLKSDARNRQYCLAASEINLIIELVKSWHEANGKQDLIAGYFATDYLDVLKVILRLNCANGQYGLNYDLLQFIQQTVFADTRASLNKELLQSVNGFYVSEPVKTAFMHNAVVVPKVFDDDVVRYVGNMSNGCREMHKAYLVERSKILQLDCTVAQNVPAFFQLFGTCENSAEYYSLLIANDEQCVLEFYSELYRRCNNIAKQNVKYFKYLKVTGEISDGNDSLLPKYKFVEKLSNCLFAECQGELVQNILCGVPSGEELLSCGLLNCDVFYFLHDLYLLDSGVKDVVFINTVSSKSYKFMDYFICTELIGKRNNSDSQFDEIFEKLIRIIAESGNTCFFSKYLLSIVNMDNILNSNRKIIAELINGNTNLKLGLNDDVQLNNQDIRLILDFCYGLKVQLGIDKLNQLCPFIRLLPVKGDLVEEADMFIKYVLFDEKLEFKTENAKLKFVEKLKTFSNNSCYLLYKVVVLRDENFYRYSYVVADKLCDAMYTHNLFPLIDSLEYLDEQNKNNLIRTIVKKIDTNGLSENVLRQYHRFFVENEPVVDAYTRDGYSASMQVLLNLRITNIINKITENMYRNLDQSIGYLFIYARDMLKNVCLLSPKALSEKGETDVNKVYAKFTEISLIVEQNGAKYIAKEYQDLIDAIVFGKITNIRDAVKLKVINDLIALLQDGDRIVAIEPLLRTKHIFLLQSIKNKM